MRAAIGGSSVNLVASRIADRVTHASGCGQWTHSWREIEERLYALDGHERAMASEMSRADRPACDDS